MASNRWAASSALRTSIEIGWVDTSWSRLYAGVASAAMSRPYPQSGFRAAVVFSPTNDANDSFNQRSFHHAIVTKSPHHMWVSSWEMTLNVRFNAAVDAVDGSAARSCVR